VLPRARSIAKLDNIVYHPFNIIGRPIKSITVRSRVSNIALNPDSFFKV
jgi:hypothetical protein